MQSRANAAARLLVVARGSETRSVSTTAPPAAGLTPDLAERLTGPDPVIGRAAEAEVREHDIDALQWLIPLLGTDRWESVPRAARIVAGFGGPALERLLELVDAEPGSRGGALAFRFVEPGHGHVLRDRLLARRSGKPSWELIRAVGEYGDVENAAELGDEAEKRDFDREVTEQVLVALERTLWAQREPRAARRVLEQMVRIASSGVDSRFPLHPSWVVHRRTLGWLDPVIESFNELTDMPAWWTARCVLWLGISRAERAVPVLRDLAGAADRPVEVRTVALQALAENGADGALDAVARAATATEGLDHAGVSSFLAAVDEAVATLARQGEDPAALAHEVLARAGEAGNDLARAAALRALGRHGKSSDAPTLSEALADTHSFVRQAAAVGLAWLIGFEAVPRLEVAYEQASEDIERIELAAALALANPDAGADVLNDRLCDPSLSGPPWAFVRPIREDILEAFATADDGARADAWAEVLHEPPSQRAATTAKPGVKAGPEAAEPEPPRGRPPAQADAEATDDQLGRERLVSVLVAMLDDKDQGTPFTFGLFGGWGEGKSSVLRQLEKRLRSDEVEHRFAIAWFNAWRYEKTDNLAAGIVQESVRGLQPEGRLQKLALGWRFAWRRDRTKVVWALVLLAVSVAATIVGAVADVLGSSVARLLVGTGLASALSIGATVIVKLYRHPVAAQLLTDLRLPNYATQLGPLPTMRQQIEHLWELRRSDGVERLVVVVDDLDRCSTDAITATLDAVRLVMDLDGVIVILALDERICLRAVAHEYKELTTVERSADVIARDFLAKIVQLPVRLEQPRSVEDFIARGLFPEEASTSAPPPSAPVPAAGVSTASTAAPPPAAGAAYAGTQTAAGSYAAAPAGALETLLAREVMRETPDERSAFRDFAAAAGVTNPRQLRRLRNTYRFIKAMAPGLHWRKLMAMLFWQELLFALPAEEFAARAKTPPLPIPQGDPMPGALATVVGGAFAGDDTAPYRDAVLLALLPRLDA